MNGKEGEVSFCTTNGVRVTVNAVSDMLLTMVEAAVEREARARGEPLDAPTYTVDVAGGGTQEFPHDETTLVVSPEETGVADPEEAMAEAERRSKANRHAWRLHREAAERLREAKIDRRMRAWFTGLDVEVPDDAWERRQRALGIEIPEDPEERRHHWIMTELLTTAEDAFAAVEACSKQTYRGMLKEDDIAAAMASFRAEVEGATSAPARARGDGMGILEPPGSAEGGEGVGRDAAEQLRGAPVRGPGADSGARTGGGPDAAGGEPRGETGRGAADKRPRKRGRPGPRPAQAADA